MIRQPTKERKLAFVMANLRLVKSSKLKKNAKARARLAKKARKELGYSPRTNSIDISLNLGLVTIPRKLSPENHPEKLKPSLG